MLRNESNICGIPYGEAARTVHKAHRLWTQTAWV